MNWYIFSAGALVIIAFFVHAVVGDKEFRLLRPETEGGNTRENDVWIQTRSGWHWVSVDLLLTGIALLLIASTDIISAKREISFLLFLYYLVTGITWLITVLLNKANNNQILVIGQWIFCFIVSGLTYIGWSQL
ncbi:MAG TPA: hypothetical protein ENJ51_01975 [Leucothrix mucor]|uniref:Uncharacterized protein n=1 Tax=Leucothrix mucor TaxID=45248 RepID=A0A7V2SY36_LEUMU|nr:hypothetical protein [Leucothrix mucor]